MKEYVEELATRLPYTLKVKGGMIRRTVQAENTCDEGSGSIFSEPLKHGRLYPFIMPEN